MKNVLVFASAGTSGFATQLAERVKRDRGARVVLVVNTEQDRAFFAREHGGLFEAIETSPFRYTSLFEPIEDEAAWIAEAAQFERRYDFRFNHLLVDDRHLGLGYSAGGTYYPTTRWAHAATFGKSVRVFVLQLRFCAWLIENYKIDLAINPTKAFCVIARKERVPTRYFVNTAFRSYFTWTVNEYMESELLPRAFARASAEPRESLVHHHDNYVRERDAVIARFRLTAALRLSFLDTLRYFYWILRRYEKRLGYRPLEQIGIHRRVWSDYRALRRNRLWRAAELEGRRFIYFPLAVEPEITLTRESPEFCHQAFAVHALAKDLPPDTVLAVKEHLFSIGTRPRSFYRDLAKIPNLVLLDPLEWGLDVIRRAATVATINGTSGFEAAVLGKPVLAFGIHNKYNVIPHVRVVDGWRDVPAAVADALAAAATPPETRLHDGQRFLNALGDVSVDCTGANFRTKVPDALFDKIMALLDRSLAHELRPLAAA